MGNACGEPQDDRCIKFFRKIISELCIGKAFRRIRRLEHHRLGGLRMMAGILFILGGMHARIVGNGNDHAGVDTRIGCCKQRVACHIQAHVFHRAEGTRARNRSAAGDLHRHLFIRRPFAVDVFVFRGIFGNFRAWRARIARSNPASRLIQAARDSLIAQ